MEERGGGESQRRHLSLRHINVSFSLPKRFRDWTLLRRRLRHLTKLENRLSGGGGRGGAGKSAFAVRYMGNFCILYSTKYQYVIFASSGHVNCSGISNFHEITAALHTIKFLLGFGPGERIGRFKLNNISASGFLRSSDGRDIDLTEYVSRDSLRRARELGLKLHYKFSGEKFAGGRLRTAFGSLLIFRNGALVIVGCNTWRHVCKMYDIASYLALRARRPDLGPERG